VDLSIGLAFIAGLVSFISPCVLPLVPAYIGYMGGRLTHTVAVQTAGGGQVTAAPSAAARFTTIAHGLAFVAGFTFIFVVLGLLGTAFIFQIGRQNLALVTDIIGRVGGVVIIFFGLHFMGALPGLFERMLRQPGRLNLVLSLAFALVGSLILVWALIEPIFAAVAVTLFIVWLFVGGAFWQPQQFWTRLIERVQLALYSDTRQQMSPSNGNSLASSAIMGVVFAAGWTPCIGPVYGAVLTMAANGGDVGLAGLLLFAYSLGLGIPFLVTAGLLDSAQGALRGLNRHMRTVKLVSGGFLVFIGVMVASGQLQSLSTSFTRSFTDLSVRIESCTLAVFGSEIGLGDLGACLSGDQAVEVDIFMPQEAALDSAPVDSTAADSAVPGSITGLAEAAPAAVERGIEVGQIAANFDIIGDDGTTTSLDDLRGQVVLVNFWATWCGPCRVEMPAFEQAYSDYRADGFAIVAVNNQETLDQITEFRAELEVTFPMALDENGAIQQLYGVRSYPSTVLIDRDGEIIARHAGILTESQLADLLADALAS
jgi:cytochrome c-type biogenesis protein